MFESVKAERLAASRVLCGLYAYHANCVPTLWDPSRAQRLQWQREGEGRSGVLEEGIPIKTEAGKMTCMRRVAKLVARSCTEV